MVYMMNKNKTLADKGSQTGKVRKARKERVGGAAMSDKLRDQDTPNVLGYDLDRKTLTPIRRTIPARIAGKDYGADPLGDNMFRMVPSGDIVDFVERKRRLA